MDLTPLEEGESYEIAEVRTDPKEGKYLLRFLLRKSETRYNLYGFWPGGVDKGKLEGFFGNVRNHGTVDLPEGKNNLSELVKGDILIVNPSESNRSYEAEFQKTMVAQS